MKKGLVLTLALLTLLGCSCSLPAQDTDNDHDNSDTTATRVHLDYPDQLKFTEGGTDNMTIYKCGACYYASTGEQSWVELYGTPPVDIEDAEFIYVEADYDLVYGGIKGYWGNKHITEVRNERKLTFDEVIDCRLVALYDKEDAGFFGVRLYVKDGENYLIFRGPMRKYSLYDRDGNLLCTYDTSMSVVSYLEDGPDNVTDYGSRANNPYAIFRIGDVYYGYSRYDGINKWTPILNMNFENRPVGFELEDGEGMKVNSTGVYLVNDADRNYVNVPMFERMDNYFSVNYTELEGEVSAKRWIQGPLYEDGTLYTYSSGLDQYLIFYIEGTHYIYCETNSEPDTRIFIGQYKTADEVNAALGRE